jgi:hypothetical protein
MSRTAVLLRSLNSLFALIVSMIGLSLFGAVLVMLGLTFRITLIFHVTRQTGVETCCVPCFP